MQNCVLVGYTKKERMMKTKGLYVTIRQVQSLAPSNSVDLGFTGSGLVWAIIISPILLQVLARASFASQRTKLPSKASSKDQYAGKRMS